MLVVVTSAAAYGKEKTIVSKFQMEHFGCKVYDKPRCLGVRQVIQTLDGNVFKLKFQAGLVYIPFRYPTDHEVKNLYRVYLTRDAVQWDPNLYNDHKEDNEWFECNTYGEGALNDEEFFASRDGFVIEQKGVSAKRKPIDFEKLRPFFL